MSLLGHMGKHISSKHFKKEDYIMLDSLPSVIKSGTESSKLIQHGFSLFATWKTQMISTGNPIPGPADNFLIRMLMATIRNKYLAATNPNYIWYIILTIFINVIFLISPFMGARKRVAVSPFLTCSVMDSVEFYVAIFVFSWGQGVHTPRRLIFVCV